MTVGDLPPRNKSQRLIDKKQKESQEKKNYHVTTIDNPQVTDICLGLNEFTDSIYAFPREIISYFTLLKEIEAKCVYTVPHLQAYIRRFLEMRKDHPKRSLLLSRIRECIRELMPCLEEKMHVSTIASDTVRKHVNKIDQAYDIIINKEIPEIIRIGPMWEPCMKVTEPKSLQQQRSESRREALAAKKAKTGFEEDYDGTAAEDSSGPISAKKGSKVSKKELKTQNASLSVVNNTKKRRNGNGIDDENTNTFNTSNNNSYNNGHNGQNSKKNKTSKTKKENKKDGVSNGNGAQNNHGSKSNSYVSGINGTNNGRVKTGSGGTGVSANTNNSNGGNSNNSSNNNSNNRNSASKTKKENIPTSPINYDGEPVYCYCQQVSYGEMVGCDGENCEKEWFHLPCTGLKEPPKGEWYCDDCKAKMIAGR